MSQAMIGAASTPHKARALEPLAARNRRGWAATRQGVQSAFRSLAAHKLRTALTTLGMLVGICGVLIVSTVAQFAHGATSRIMSGAGASMISVDGFAEPPKGQIVTKDAPIQTPPTLTLDDAHAIRRLPHVVAVTTLVGVGGPELVAGDQTWKPQAVQGAFPDVQIVQGLSVKSGAFFTDADLDSAAPVAVIGPTVASKLFPGQDPIGKTMRLAPSNVDVTVVGVLNARGSNGERDQDDVAILPATTLMRKIMGPIKGGKAPSGGGGLPPDFFNNFPGLQVQVDSPGNLAAVQQSIAETLRRSHRIAPGGKDDFRVSTFAQAMQAASQSDSAITLVMGIVAAVVLVVSGLGIANVMLASVSERRREIGVRVAVGAEPRDILRQFLVEATTLSIVDGALGILLGFAVPLGLPRLLRLLVAGASSGYVPAGLVKSLPPQLIFLPTPTPASVAIALAVSILIGVAFGLIPARRAAHLDPVAALRR